MQQPTPQTKQDTTTQNTPSEISPSSEAPNTFDQKPVGKGANNNFSQFPDESFKPRVPKNKPALKKQKQKTQIKQAKQNVRITTIKSDNRNTPLDEIPIAKNTFDEKPIGKTDTFNISEFPEGIEQPPQQTHFTMMQKLKSKAIKLRLSGMEDMIQMLNNDETNPELNEIQLVGYMKESTPANLEKILMCFKVWISKGRQWGQDETKSAIENGFINGKPNTKKIAIQIVDSVFEIKPNIIEMLVGLGLKNKTPKTIAGYITVINELLAIYGIKKMNYLKAYLKEIVKILNTEKNVAVKTQGLSLLKQAYKWMGEDVVKPMLLDLKENFQKDLETFWQGYDQDTIMSAPKDVPDQNNGKNKTGKKLDAYEISQPIDIFKRYNDKWVDSVLKAEKWNEKTKLMEEFVKSASVPKLANTEFRQIVELIRRLINDSNFNVVLWTLRVFGAMCKGLRKHFFGNAKNQFSNIICKFRDKKTQMVEQTFNTLKDLMYSISIEDVLQDVKQGLGDKAPNMKVNLLNWIGRIVEQKFEEKNGDISDKTLSALKSLFGIFEKLLGDGTSDVRDCMAKNIGKMKMYLGDDFFSPIESKMNKNLVSKVGTSEIKGKQSRKILQKQEKDMTKSSVSVKPKKQARNDSFTKTQTIIIQKQKTPSILEKLVSYQDPTFEQSIAALVSEGFPEDQVKNVTAAGSKQRSNILNIMKENPYENFNCVVRVLKKSLRDWKEVNLMMNKQFVAYIEQRKEQIKKEEIYVLLPYIIQKSADNKFSENINKIVTSICQRIPGSFIIGHILRFFKHSDPKKPKMNGDACTLITKIIENVSISNTPIKQTIQFGKQTYQVPFSKKAGSGLLCCIYSYLGEQVKVYLDQSTFKSLDGEFKTVKILQEDQKKPNVEFEGQAAQKNSKKAVNLLADRPKTDITSQVQRLLPKLNDGKNWQNRKDSAEALISLINQNFGRVIIHNISDLIDIVKNRINDPNKQLIKVFVNLAGVIFQCLSEKQIKIFYKQFVHNLVEGLADKNEQNKKQIHLTLNKIGDIVGKEIMLAGFGAYLQTDSQARLQILDFMMYNEDSLVRTETKGYTKGIVNCLCDKNRGIKTKAEQVFQMIYERNGIQSFRAFAKDQKPAVAKDLNAFFDKYDKNNASASSFPSKGVSPIKIMEKQKRTVMQHPPVSAKKRSLSKHGSRTEFNTEQDEHYPNSSTISNFNTVKSRTLIQNDDYFAPVKSLTAERIQRQQTQDNYIWRFDQIKQIQQDELKDSIQRLIRYDLSKRMMSFDHKRVVDSAIQIIKICKDPSYQSHIRQLFDIISKWTLMRLWGGSPSLHTLVEVIPPVLSILQKKKLNLNDFQVDLILSIIRQYMITIHLNEFKVSQSLYLILKSLTTLNSGEKVLKKILRQFNIELTSIHRHIKRQTTAYYRDGLAKLVKTQLIEYVGNEDTLQEASKIRQLKNDPQFVEMLFRRFHENVLSCFGFKLGHQVNNSGIQGSNSMVSERNEKSNEKKVNRGHSYTNVDQPPRPSSNNSYAQKKANNANNVQETSRSRTPVSQNSPPQSTENIVMNNGTPQLNLSKYHAPHPFSPLGKHLNQLYPPNQGCVSFFNSLFIQSGNNITSELQTNAKMIFGSILKSVNVTIMNRKEIAPEKIVNQINLLQNCIKCNSIIKNIGQLLYHGTYFALTQLVYEDQNKALIHQNLKSRNIEFRIQNFIKAINSVMLRILQNGNPSEVINILLDLLIQNGKSRSPSPKTMSLIIKCIGRVSSKYLDDPKIQNIRQFFVKVNQYLAVINFGMALEQLELGDKQHRERVNPEITSVNNIKMVLITICQKYNTEVWQIYEKAMQHAKYPDQHINSFITSMNIRFPEKVRTRSQQKQNQELKKINQLLSKSKTFDLGIINLKKYCSKHQQFNPLQYFTSQSFDQKFISMVMGQLEGKATNSIQRKTPMKQTRDLSQNRVPDGAQNIQDKIKKLKQKFQQTEQSPNQKPTQSRAPQKMQEDTSRQRAQQIKRRIDQMKNKMNSAVNRR